MPSKKIHLSRTTGWDFFRAMIRTGFHYHTWSQTQIWLLLLYCVKQGNQPVLERSWLDYDVQFNIGLQIGVCMHPVSHVIHTDSWTQTGIKDPEHCPAVPQAIMKDVYPHPSTLTLSKDPFQYIKNLVLRLKGIKQKKSSSGSAMNDTFLLFYSPKPRSSVWIFIHQNCSILDQIMTRLFVTPKFESVGKIRSCYQSNKASLVEL